MEGKQKQLLEEETELNSRQEVQHDTVCPEIRNKMSASSLMYCTPSLESRLSVPDFVLQLWRKIDEPRLSIPDLSCSFGEKSIFLQSCETKSGTESLDSRLGVHHHSNLVSIETGS